MFAAIIATLGLLFTVQAHALSDEELFAVIHTQQLAIKYQAGSSGLTWKRGDEAHYNLQVGSTKGSMLVRCTRIADGTIWMDLEMDYGFRAIQQVTIEIKSATGEFRTIAMRGGRQWYPKSNLEVVEVKEERIVVPAGAFNSAHVRLNSKDTRRETNIWFNPMLPISGELPLSGMLKTTHQGRFGTVTIELKSFHNN